MKKLRDVASVKEKKTVVAISKEKKKEFVKRDPLPKGMKYVIKTVPHHPLRFGISFSRNFAIDVEYFVEFNKIENGRYEQYPWGKIAFNKLMNSLRQDFFVEKQLYRLGGMPHVLNVWMYKYCSEVDKGITCRIGNRIPRICNWFVVGTKPKFKKSMNRMFRKPNHDEMDLKDSVNSTLPFTSCRQPIKVDQKAKMTIGSLLLDDFDDFTIPPQLELLTRSKSKSNISLAPPSKRRKTNAERKESVTDQEKIKVQPSVEEVNESPSGTSNKITDLINEEAPHEPSLIDFNERTPPVE
ncbi:hypothetical protein FXO37_08404 [Capsicum annuum]|nr:hypothetical protein FXO37_08404 [Capsicum annuum]